MNTIDSLVRCYIATFNEKDARKRREAIDELYVEACGYTDPHVALAGRDAIDQFIAGVHERMPEIVFSLASEVDAHHDQARFTWHAAPAGASKPLAVGFDVLVLEDGRIRQVYGFLDATPS